MDLEQDYFTIEVGLTDMIRNVRRHLAGWVLGTLLTAHGGLDATAWRDAEDTADEAHLLRHGVTPGVLELAQVSALYDAAYFALAPSSAPGRFRYGGAHWLAAVHPVPVDDLERETLRRRALLRHIWPDPAIDGAPLVRADPVAAPAVPSRQAAVLARVDGVRKAVDIARELGRPAFHTLVHLRRLAAAGLVCVRTPPHQDHPSQDMDRHRTPLCIAPIRDRTRVHEPKGGPSTRQGTPIEHRSRVTGIRTRPAEVSASCVPRDGNRLRSPNGRQSISRKASSAKFRTQSRICSRRLFPIRPGYPRHALRSCPLVGRIVGMGVPLDFEARWPS